jgi:hypothetical protein
MAIYALIAAADPPTKLNLHRRSHRFQALREPPRIRELGTLHRPRHVARRLIQHDGLRGDEVSEVRCYADQMLRTPAQPLDAPNRRISGIVQNLEPKPQGLEKTDGKPETSAAAKNPRKRG